MPKLPTRRRGKRDDASRRSRRLPSSSGQPVLELAASGRRRRGQRRRHRPDRLGPVRGAAMRPLARIVAWSFVDGRLRGGASQVKRAT